MRLCPYGGTPNLFSCPLSLQEQDGARRVHYEQRGAGRGRKGGRERFVSHFSLLKKKRQQMKAQQPRNPLTEQRWTSLLARVGTNYAQAELLFYLGDPVFLMPLLTPGRGGWSIFCVILVYHTRSAWSSKRPSPPQSEELGLVRLERFFPRLLTIVARFRLIHGLNVHSRQSF